MNKFLILFLLTSFSLNALAGATGEVLGDTAKGAAVGAVAGAAGSKAAQEYFPNASKKIGDFFDSPPGILTMSGIATVYSGMLFNAAAKQEEDAEDNIKKIDRIMAEFKDSYVGFCPTGHDDLSVPDCYCYLAKGGKNPDRTKSQICQTLWAKNDFRLSAVAGDYKGLSKFVDPVGCLTSSGQFDETCKCKKFLNSKGVNACQKGTSITLPGGIGAAMLSNTGLKDVMQMAANAGNGNPMFNNFGTGQLALKAVATDNLRNQLISKLAASNGSPNGGLPRLNESNIAAFTKAIVGQKDFAAMAANSSGSALGAASSGPTDPALQKELKTAAAKAGLDFSGSGKGLANKKIENKETFAFNMGGEAGQAAGAGQLQDFPEQEKVYKVKGDISKRTDASIFEIILNRYIQSGLKRLFDE